MQVLRYCTAAIFTALAAIGGTAAQQQAPAGPAPGEATFLIFAGNREIGREQVSLSRSASGWTIVSTGRIAPPLNLTNNRFEITYSPDWQPIQLTIDARVQDRSLTLSTSFATTTAINEITQNGVTNSKNDQISARTIVVPNNFYGAYEALAVRLAQSAAGAELPIYVAPQGEIKLTVRSITPTTFQTPAGALAARRFAVTFQNPGGPLAADVTVDDRSRLAKLELAGGAMTVTRQDIAGVATRQHTFRNPTDVDVQFSAAGFTLAGTLTTPQAQGRLRHPALVLVPGSGTVDRDGTVAGIPLLAQLAGQLADAGFVVLRYDKRGVGQSGGRTETVTLRDYADDAVAAVKWIARRKDVDDKRVFAAGHSEGAAVAMLAAREKRIKALVLMAPIGTTGRELILEQQQALLDASNVAEPERTEKIELQKKILDAAIAEKGWETLPPEVRPHVDTPFYRSLLTFEPASVMKDARQPILIIHGELDKQVRPHHAQRLAEAARARKKAAPVELKNVPGLNHLLVPAKTGEVSEDATLEGKSISPEVAKIIAAWLAAVPR